MGSIPRKRESSKMRRERKREKARENERKREKESERENIRFTECNVIFS